LSIGAISVFLENSMRIISGIGVDEKIICLVVISSLTSIKNG
jgi:hypothetical protein